MAFRVRHGNLEGIIALAAMAGTTIRKQREQEIALDMARFQAQQAARVKMAKFQVEAQTKARQQEMMFQLQKEQIRAQNTFAMKEQLRMQKMQDEYIDRSRKEHEYQNALDAIDNADYLSPDEKKRLTLNTQLKHRMGPSAPQLKDTSMQEMKLRRATEEDIDYYQSVEDRYTETKDISNWPFTKGLGEYDLGYKDEDGKWNPATLEQKLMYDYAKKQLNIKMQQLRGGPDDPLGGGVFDPLGVMGGAEEPTFEMEGPPEPRPGERPTVQTYRPEGLTRMQDFILWE